MPHVTRGRNFENGRNSPYQSDSFQNDVELAFVLDRKKSLKRPDECVCLIFFFFIKRNPTRNGWQFNENFLIELDRGAGVSLQAKLSPEQVLYVAPQQSGPPTIPSVGKFSENGLKT